MGHPPAEFEQLYQAELAWVLRTLRRLGVAHADLEDAAHDLFVIAFRRRADRDRTRPVRPWLFGIAYRVVGNYLQKAHRRREVGSGAEPAGPGASPEEQVAREQEREQLLAALASLDLEHRAVAVLYEIEGLTAPAIAEALGLPLNTVYSRARNARRKLLEALARLRGGEP